MGDITQSFINGTNKRRLTRNFLVGSEKGTLGSF